jgi:signal transduction histidine kinase
MSLKRIDLKITLWHLGLLIISSSFLSLVFYFLFSKSLNIREHELLESKFQTYYDSFKTKGIKQINENLNASAPFNDNGHFFARIADPKGMTIYFQTTSHSNVFKLKEIESGMQSLSELKRWYYIKTDTADNDIEVLNYKMADGNFFQVGKTIEDKEELLKRFIKIFSETLLIAVILGGVGGIFLSSRMLQPIRSLIATLKSIQTGHDEARVPLPTSHDELEELSLLFNSMLDRIQTSNQGMRQTLDTVAHELRTPLTSIRGLAEVTLQKKNFKESEYRQVLEDCIEGIDEILTEFKMMTDITEVESGLQNLHKEPVDLQSICQDIIELYEIIAEQKEIKINLKLSAPLYLIADKKKLRQVLANLVDNAIKYSPEHTEINICIEQIGRSAIIKIADQGIGISENEMPLIWKRLYRGENSRSQKGIGLGLSLVKSIVEAHQGEIVVEKNKEQGSVFTITLPC